MSGEHGPPITRRRVLKMGAVAGPAALLAACIDVSPSPSAGTLAPSPTASPSPSAPPSRSPSATPLPPVLGSILFRGAALADGRSPNLRRGVSILVEEGVIRWIRDADGEGDPGGADIIDAAGATVVPGLVDAHTHLTGPGGAHWIDRFADPTERLVAYAEENARLAWGAGVRWLRDAGSPVRPDPEDGRRRALAIGLRDRWRGRRDYPAIRAAGSWLTRPGSLPAGLAVEARNADELLAAAMQQLDDGADLVKLYFDGPDGAPWSVAEVSRVANAVHARGARVTAHAGLLGAARLAAAAGLDAVEHGFNLDADVVRRMAEQGIVLVTTLSVYRSWLTFGATTQIPFFAGSGRPAAIRDQLEAAEASLRLARDAGVPVAAGTDFGGGSSRANHLPWEFESLVGAGLEPVDALAAVTWRGGELLGEPDAGSLREGGPATFFLVHGDPLTEPAALWRVWRHA